MIRMVCDGERIILENDLYSFEAEREGNGLKLLSLRSMSFGDLEEVHVPAEVDGLPVLALDSGFSGTEFQAWQVKRLFLPDSIARIESGALRCVQVAKLVETGHPCGRQERDLLLSLDGKTVLANLLPQARVIAVPQGVEAIGDGAFAFCRAEHILLPQSLRKIGVAAFSWTERLRCISIPDGVRQIEKSAFFRSGLVAAILPEGLEYLGARAFAGAQLLEVTLPGSLRQIGHGAFAGNTGLHRVRVCEGVTELGESCLRDCSDLREVILPSTLHTIDSQAFAGCEMLKELILPEGVRRIANGAFENSAMQRLHLPATLEAIASDAFTGCAAIRQITIAEENPVFCVVGGGLYDRAMTRLVHWADRDAEEVILPDTLVCMDEEAFCGMQALRRVVIPSTVQALPDRAFLNCGHLEEVALPEELCSIGTQCFECCGALRRIALPEGLTELGDRCFAASGLEEIALPASLMGNLDESEKRIEDFLRRYMPAEGEVPLTQAQFDELVENADVVLGDEILPVPEYFAECQALRRITLPDSMRSVGAKWLGAFTDCSAIADMNVPLACTDLRWWMRICGDQLENIRISPDHPAFRLVEGALYSRDMTRLICWSAAAGEDVILTDTVTQIAPYAFRKAPDVRSVRLPAGVTELPDNLFRDCRALETVVLPEGVQRIGEGCFMECTALQRLSAPSASPEMGEAILPEGLTELGACAFGHCVALRRIVLPSTVTKLPGYTLTTCEGLEEVVLPEGLTSIGECAFWRCSALKRVVLPASLREIGDSAFFRCETLKKVDLPEGLQTIGRYAFSGTAVERMRLPDSVTSVGARCFEGCGKLGRVRLSPAMDHIPDAICRDCDSPVIELPMRGDVTVDVKELVLRSTPILRVVRHSPLYNMLLVHNAASSKWWQARIDIIE